MITATLIGAAVLNAGTDLSAATEYRLAHAIGLTPALCGGAVVAADWHTVCDLERVCGPATALWAPVGTAVAAHVGATLCGSPGLPALSSLIVAGFTWVMCREENP